MRDHLADGSPVADRESLETPLTFQHVPLQVDITGSRDAVEVLKEFMKVAAPASSAALKGGR